MSYADINWTESGPYVVVASSETQIVDRSLENIYMGMWVDFDVKSAVQNFVASPGSNRGFIFKPNIRWSAGMMFHSSEATNAQLRPRLVITYENGGLPPPPLEGDFTSADTMTVNSGENFSYVTAHNGGDNWVLCILVCLSLTNEFI